MKNPFQILVENSPLNEYPSPLLRTITNKDTPPPTQTFFRITVDGEVRITVDADKRIVQTTN